MAIQKGTGFTNLNRIMQANQGNKLGKTVAGGIQQQAQGVNTQVKSAQQQFEEEAEKGRLDTAEAKQKRSEVLSRFSPSSGVANLPAQQTASSQPQAPQPQSIISDKDVEDFTKFRTGTYAGPKQIKDSDVLAGQAQQVEQLGELTRSQGGRQELLRRFVGGGGYTQGQKQLDVSLLGQSNNGINAAGRQARGSVDAVQTANTRAANLAQNFANQAKAFNQETAELLTQAQTPINEQINKAIADAQAQDAVRQEYIDRINRNLMTNASARLSPQERIAAVNADLDEALKLGFISQADVDSLRQNDNLIQRATSLGIDPNRQIKESIKNLVAQNLSRTGVATDEQATKLNALARLSGKQGSDLEFDEDRERFTPGQLKFDVDSLADQVYRKEFDNAAAQFEKAKRSLDKIYKKFTVDGKGGYSTSVSGAKRVKLEESRFNDAKRRMEQTKKVYDDFTRKMQDKQDAEILSQSPNVVMSDETKKRDISYSSNDVQKFMDRIKPAAYNYKDEVKDKPYASKDRELGVMAQDLEKSELGKEAVHDTPDGKIVDYNNLEPKMLASIAALNKRLKELENKK